MLKNNRLSIAVVFDEIDYIDSAMDLQNMHAELLEHIEFATDLQPEETFTIVGKCIAKVNSNDINLSYVHEDYWQISEEADNKFPVTVAWRGGRKTYKSILKILNDA